MITMLMLLCYIALSGMSMKCIVIVLMNNLLLVGQECTDTVNVQQNGTASLGYNGQAIIPRLNFTCNGRITGIRARLRFFSNGDTYPFFQVWRAASVDSTIYNKIGEVQLQSDGQVTGSSDYRTASIILTNNNTIEVQSGDVVGYYHPSNARYVVRDIQTDGYYLYRFNGSPAADNSEDLSQRNARLNNRQPLIQFDTGMYH